MQTSNNEKNRIYPNLTILVCKESPYWKNTGDDPLPRKVTSHDTVNPNNPGIVSYCGIENTVIVANKKAHLQYCTKYAT